MLSQFTSADMLHHRIRKSWRRYVLPALLNHDADAMLAALVIADTSLDEVLRAEGCAGGTVGERIQHAMHTFSNYPALLAARQTRNRVVHNLDCHLCLDEAGAALAAYQHALWDHGVRLTNQLPGVGGRVGSCAA